MVIKMKDLIAQQKFLNEKFIKEEDPPVPGGGEEEKPKISIQEGIKRLLKN